MVVSCCAFGCTNRHGDRDGLGFFRFPNEPVDRRIKWINAVKRKDWEPSKHSRICGDHFVSGKPVNILDHVDYIPTLFTFCKSQDKNTKRKQKEARQTRYEKGRQKLSKEENEADQKIAIDALLLLQSSSRSTHRDVFTQTTNHTVADIETQAAAVTKSISTQTTADSLSNNTLPLNSNQLTCNVKLNII